MPFFKPWATSKPSQIYTPLAEDEDTEKRRGSSLSSEETFVHPLQKRSPILTYVLIGLSSANLLCLFLLFYVSTHHGTTDTKKSVVPELPLMMVNFDKDDRFSGPPSPDNNAAWDSILPPGRGFVFVENPEEYHLRPGVPTKFGTEIYSVSMFHQLHCLGLLRKSYWALLNGITNHNEDIEHEAARQINNTHSHHCFDYIRQGIMCSGDMTMEWPKVETNGSRYRVDGWGVPHECKSWDSIWDYMMVNKYNASQHKEID